MTERQFRPDANGEPTAILVQDDYLAVSGATVTFPAPHMPDEGRAIPFPEVGVTDAGAGPVERAAITLADGTTISTDNAWVVTREGVTRMVSYAATDRTGRDGITFTMPAIFVTDEHAYTVQDEVNGVRTPLGNLATYLRRGAGRPGRARPRRAAGRLGRPRPAGHGGLRPGHLEHPDLPGPPGPGRRNRPLRRPGRARGRRDGRRSTRGSSTRRWSTRPPPPCSAATGRRSWSGTRTPGSRTATRPATPVWPSTPWSTTTAVERSGTGAGLVKPALKVTTFSQTLGAGTELTLRSNLTGEPEAVWDPGEALVDTLGEAAVLFGQILLSDIVGEVNAALGSLSSERGMPRFETLLEEDGLHYLMTWEPELKTLPIARRAGLRGGRRGLPGQPPTRPAGAVRQQRPAGTEFELVLDNVTLRLPPAVPAVEIDFKRVRYFEPRGGTSSLESELDDWRFIEVLAFLEPVRQVVVTLLDLGRHRGRPGGRLRRRRDPGAQPGLRRARRDQPEDRPRAGPAQRRTPRRSGSTCPAGRIRSASP